MAVGLLAAGALIGGGLNAAGAAIKTKVKAPPAPKVNAGKEAGKAIEANIQNLPQAQLLAEQVNAFNQDQLMSTLKEFSPYAQETAQAQSKALLEQAQGKIPKDVAQQMYRSLASGAVGKGVTGSGFQDYTQARQVGLTSLQLMNQSLANSNVYLSGVRQNLMAPNFDVASMFISPSQQIQTEMWNETNRFNRDYLASQLRAAQSAATAFGNSLQQMGTGLTGASMGALGGSMGSMGGMMGGGGGGGGGGGFSPYQQYQVNNMLAYQPQTGGYGGYGVSYGSTPSYTPTSGSSGSLYGNLSVSPFGGGG